MDIKNTKHVEREARLLGYVQNILTVYRSATADQITEGKRWYPETKATIDRIMTENALTAGWRPTYQAFAALSPRISFQENVEGFEKFCKSQRYAGSQPLVAGVSANRNKAWAYLTGESIEWIDLKGAPKTARFALNLEGDLSYVTVDVWAARAAGFTKSDVRGNDYLELEEAYKRVAIIAGFEPAELQAIVWIVVRGSAS